MQDLENSKQALKELLEEIQVRLLKWVVCIDVCHVPHIRLALCCSPFASNLNPPSNTAIQADIFALCRSILAAALAFASGEHVRGNE